MEIYRATRTISKSKKIKFLVKEGNQEGMIVGSRGGYPGTKIGGSDTVKKISILLTLGNSTKM